MEEKLNLAVELITDCFRRGGRLLVCGNGGSAADSAHITGEFVKGFLKKRPLPQELKHRIGHDWANTLQQGLCCIDLTANPGAISATANDISGPGGSGLRRGGGHSYRYFHFRQCGECLPCAGCCPGIGYEDRRPYRCDRRPDGAALRRTFECA